MRLLPILIVSLIASVSLAQTTQPVRAETEIRAQEAFARGEYALALPLLKKVAESVKSDSARLAAVEEQIRVCERNLGAAPATQPATDNSKRVPHVKPKAGQTLSLTIKDLGNFDYDNENGGNIPKDIQDLNGSLIRLTGFMIPMEQTEKISKFALVPSLLNCCYGQAPQIQHTIIVTCPAGKAVSYYPDEIAVEGKLKVDEKKDEGYIISLFDVDAVSVSPVAR